MGAAVVSVVGRDEELRAARAALEVPRGGAVVFRGEAGIGKTTLWEASTASALAAGRRVLVARPVEAEQRLGLVAFTDLLQPVADEVLPELPPPQRRALEVALLLTEAEDCPPDPRTLGAALIGSLRIVGGEAGAVLAVDDFQWVDPASRGPLEFALRRLSAARASAVLAIRTGATNAELPSVDRAVPVAVVDVAPFSIGALHRLLLDRLGESVPRTLLRRVHAASGGNPLYALEIARGFLDVGYVSADQELPIPTDLDQLLRERIRVLPARTRRALAAAAALSEPRIEWVEPEGDLQPALDAGYVRVAHGIVRFSHPLLASAAYAALAPSRRRDLHKRLAVVADNVEEVARHLALAHPGPDESVASVLAGAAERALARGAPAAAGELLELALERTSDLRRRPELLTEAGQAYYSAGDTREARRLVELALAELAPGPERARVLSLLSALQRDNLEAAVMSARQAWAEAQGDPAAEALAARQVSLMCGFAGELAEARRFARRALVRADGLPDQLLVAVIATAACVEVWATGRTDLAMLERGVAAEVRSGSPRDAVGARLMFATQLFLDQRLSEARCMLENLAIHLEEVGNELRLSEALNHLALVEMLAGRPARAAELATRGLELLEQCELPHVRALMSFLAGQPAVYLGRIKEARGLAESGLAAATAAGDVGAWVQASAVLGFLELSLGNPAGAVEALAPAAERIAREAPGLNPAQAPVLPNLIEALIALGRIEEARIHLGELEARGRELNSAWALSQAARAYGSISAAEGDTATALARFEDALREHARMEGPFERGRTLLAQGAVLRRSRQWAAARASIAAAVAIFEQVEAPLWAERARTELRRVGGRRAKEGLTATEERIARLVAAGRSNKEIARESFVTVRTVEAHLTRVYAKLGVHSRSQLARLIAS